MDEEENENADRVMRSYSEKKKERMEACEFVAGEDWDKPVHYEH